MTVCQSVVFIVNIKWMIWILFILSCAYSLEEIHISACDAPISSLTLSICCFTKNLPSGASVVFLNNSSEVARISQSCDLWYPINKADVNFTLSCGIRGNVSVYSIVFPGQNFSSDGGHNTWSCGFYVSKAEMRITVLDDHKYLKQASGSTASLHYSLHDSAPIVGTVRLCNMQLNHTVLEVDLNNTVIYKDDRIVYTGNVTQEQFSCEIHNVSQGDNGTYICLYTNDIGTRHHGITIVVPGVPPKPKARNVSVWNRVGEKMSGQLMCMSTSGSAAPLFYLPKPEVKWIYPSLSDSWQPGISGYDISTNGSTAYISGVDCKKTSLPVYCFVKEEAGISEISEPFYPQTMCTTESKESSKPDPNSTSTTDIITTVFGVIVQIVLVSAIVYFLLTIRKLRRQISQGLRRRLDTDNLAEVPHRNRRFMLWNHEPQPMPNNPLALADGLRAAGSHNEVIQRATGESSQHVRQRQHTGGGRPSGDSNYVLSDERSRLLGASDRQSRPVSSLVTQGAEGGTSANNTLGRSDLAELVEVETLIQRHHDHLQGLRTITINRHRLVDSVLEVYQDEQLASSRVIVRMSGEEGLDGGGVTADMFTDFWNRVQELFFIGCERVVPELQAHRLAEEGKFRILGRILSHSIAVMKTFPIPMCKSTIIAMIYDTTEVAAETLLEDFLYFLDDHERALVTSAINHYSTLTTDQVTELAGLFERFNYGAVPTNDTFRHHVTQLARHVTCIQPRTLLELMRSGIPQDHLNHFWSQLHLNALDVHFKALRPTAERVIARLMVADNHRGMNRRQTMVLQFLKDLLKEMTEMELQTFLHFVTGKKSIPRTNITIQFTREIGLRRLPKVHTCSNMMELPETYEDYDTFRSEFKNLLASDVAMTMTMA